VTTNAKFCRILATLGPASDAEDRMLSLLKAGVNAFRINFSHGNHEDHQKRFETVRRAEQRFGAPVPILADLQGPKIRIGALKGGQQTLAFNDTLRLVLGSDADEDGVLPIPHKELFDVLKSGDMIMLDDGMVRLKIEKNDGNQAIARVLVPGILTDRKGINIPGRRLPISALTQKDREDLDFALTQGADYIALSFVQCADDVREAKKLVLGRAKLVAKIEKPAALDEIEDIIALADVIMVARGDLGVELPLEQVPVQQNRILRIARSAGKPVIVATQMLQSMIDSPIPTRAEASDIATAVYRGTDCVMLSAETAVGRHPETVVAIMSRIIQEVERDEFFWQEVHGQAGDPEPHSAEAIAVATRHTIDLLNCRGIIANTKSGSTALAMARERPRARILAITPHIETARQLAMVWGVRPIVTPDFEALEDVIKAVPDFLREHLDMKKGDRAIITAGVPMGVSGTTNTMQILTLED
jgi:pyruvate kinase